MSHRLFPLAIMTLLLAPLTLLGQQNDVTTPDVANSKFQFDGVINSNSVHIRSGPGEQGYYSTQELPKGTHVIVVGIKFDWLKIVPPKGSFSFVGKQFVERHGDGSTGKINASAVNIRAGSAENAMKTTVQTRLNAGDQVQITGEEDDYYRIEPPAGVYLYVNKQFVDMYAPINPAPVNGKVDGNTPPTPPAGLTQTDKTAHNADQQTAKNTPPSIDVNDGPSVTITPGPTTQPIASAGGSATTQPVTAAGGPATTQPTAASVADTFDKLEAQYAEISKKPLEDQDLKEISGGYQSIAKADGLSDMLKHVVDLRIATLKVRTESQARLIEALKLEKDAHEKELAMQAEQQELQERIRSNEVKVFTAVGTLQPSSLQMGNGGTLFRLTDPATGRTVVYIRSNDTKVTSLIGQFIGVKGETVTDSQLSLRIITPTEVETVDPAKVNGAVAAEIIPPSLLARQASAQQ